MMILTKRSTALLLILIMLFTGLMGSGRVQAEAESANRIVFEDSGRDPDDYNVEAEPPFAVHVMETTSTTVKLQWNPLPSSDISQYVIYNGDSPAASVSFSHL